ncbi:FtsK/SpoIIIE domain-containing protein [Streptomyces polyrhachis]|uniref:FtsK/SpoIIIE domain-containing protein n=1 Tax=Streptomyces polyrhachis TaxID=1282885 RepID=A0ABW2GEQ1_9ACTN
MQIRMTVLGPQGPQGGRGSSVDVLVTAPSGTPLSAVAVGLADAVAAAGALEGAAGGAGAPPPAGGALYAGERLLDPDRSILGEPPLVDGAVLGLGAPGVAGEPADAPVRLLVASGPDAGGVHLLHGGQVRIGRSADAEVPLDDPDVSRLHCAVTVDADGRAAVLDLDSTNGTTVDGAPVGRRPVPLRQGAVLRVGESVLRVAGNAAPGAGPAAFSEAPPDDALYAGGTHGSGLVVPGPGATPLRGTPAPSLHADTAPVRRGGLKAWARRFGAGPAPLSAQTPAPTTAEPFPGASPRAADPFGAPQRERWPDPAEVLLTALGGAQEGLPGARLGERDAEHPDALSVRLGTAYGQGRPTPLVASLREAGSLGLAGPRPRLLGLARSVLAQLAVLHAVDELELVLIAPDRLRPLAERLADWSWLGWLPQLRPARGQDCRLLTAYDREQAAARLGELLRRLERDPGGPAHTVVVVDGDPGPPDQREALARLAVRGPAAGIHLLCLAATPAASPRSPLTESYAAACAATPGFAECGAVGLLTGEVATGLRLLRRPLAAAEPPSGESGTGHATGRGWLYGPGPDPQGSPGGDWFAAAVAEGRRAEEAGLPRVAGADPARGAGDAPGAAESSGRQGIVDAVSAAWAERPARALAPLRPAGREAGGGRAGELPLSVRLLDELGLARATPAALTARWAQQGRPLAVLGACARGPLEVDLDTDGVRHLFIEGPAGSGRTELIRSLAASLAASERPDRLQLVLIDGGGAERGEGLRVVTELPHVTTYLPANDPRRMREFAQALAAELKRRAEVLAASLGAYPVPGQRSGSDEGSDDSPSAGPGRPGAPTVSGFGDLDAPPPGYPVLDELGEGTLRLRRREPAPPAVDIDPEARMRLARQTLAEQPRLVILVDDYDALTAPALGSPARPAAGSVLRALDTVVRDGGRLGVDLIAASGRPGLTAQSAARTEAGLLVRLGCGSDLPPGRGELHQAGQAPVAFQAGRVTGRIPRTATARPTVVPLEWERMGAPPTSRPLRELGNGPTDLALLASALQRAAQSAGATSTPALA